ncbi:thyroid peroxidase-like [Cetorhinus maximus]
MRTNFAPCTELWSSLTRQFRECITSFNHTGDIHANEHIRVSVMYMLFLRKHNRLVRELKKLTHWNGETIYQEIITYNDYLPKIIDSKAMVKFLPKYKGYDSSIDPSIKDAFATASFRFGHANVHEIAPCLNESYQEHPEFPNLQLRHSFFIPRTLIKQGYNAWRRFGGLYALQNKEELSKLLKNPALADQLLKLYGTPENIDLWMGGIIEPFVTGGRVGPLFACLIGKQFKGLRDGDRFHRKIQHHRSVFLDA